MDDFKNLLILIDEMCIELEYKQEWSLIKKLEAVKKILNDRMLEEYIDAAL
jgi:hypothetical protein